ncbi:MAG: hypothetical protein M1834_009206 [Cirrosporium novae-zelandiae]|nr:MAG: hypothetical protein M1834_009206 [Cirrosporium novae-zelandiae]
MAEETIVVIGAGIIGLSAALRIQECASRKQRVLIIAREFPSDRSPNYASSWAGAHYRYVPEDTEQEIREAQWANKSYAVFVSQLANEPECGIGFFDHYEYFPAPSPTYLNLKACPALPNFRVLEKSELPEGIKHGYLYDSWCINSPLYCEHLLRKFELKGGKTMKYQLQAPEEVFVLVPNAKTVVNASGKGFNDPAVFISRGQTVTVSNPCDRTVTQQNEDGSWSYIIPRPLNGGTLIGGTKQANNWDPNPDPAVLERMLRDAAHMHPAMLNAEGGFDIVRQSVGRRPMRGDGMRLEIEEKGDAKRVVHSYGACGRGYELSWGVADEVIKMVFGKDADAKASL